MKKEKVLKILLGKMRETDISNLDTIEQLPEIGISAKQFALLFPNGTDEMIMDAIEYAGSQWLECLKKNIKETERKSEKTALLLNSYALGAEEFSHNLSLYIDLWKIIKDGKNAYLKQRLRRIYDMYINEFSVIMNEIGTDWLNKEEIHILGVLMTAVSDAIHIQCFTADGSVDFSQIRNFISKLTRLMPSAFKKDEGGPYE